ncbi:MAG: histidine--tRNA ligase, partial [Bacteriovoracia bacterium]
FVAIRPEMTPTLARMVAQVHKQETKPIRWYAIPNLMRYEQPQKGRLREHWQFNCDIFGAPGRMGELEILQLAIVLMQNFGATSEHFSILLNDREIVDTVFKRLLNLSDAQTYALYKVVDKAKKVDSEALDKMAAEIVPDEISRKIFHRYLGLTKFDDLFMFLQEHNISNYSESFKHLVDEIHALKLEKYIQYDPTIVRGLDYYTGVVFEIFDKHPDNRRAICGGGSYANLLKIFNENPLPGVGFGLGDVTLTDFLKTHDLLPPNCEKPKADVFLSFQIDTAATLALQLATQLRQKGLNVVTNLEPIKFKKVFSAAEKRGAKFVFRIDQRELENNEVQIKNMSNRNQDNMKLNDIDGIYHLIKQA